MEPQLSMAPAWLERLPVIGRRLDAEIKVASVSQACVRVAAESVIPRHRTIIRRNEISQDEVNLVTDLR